MVLEFVSGLIQGCMIRMYDKDSKYKFFSLQTQITVFIDGVPKENTRGALQSLVFLVCSRHCPMINRNATKKKVEL